MVLPINGFFLATAFFESCASLPKCRPKRVPELKSIPRNTARVATLPASRATSPVAATATAPDACPCNSGGQGEYWRELPNGEVVCPNGYNWYFDEAGWFLRWLGTFPYAFRSCWCFVVPAGPCWSLIVPAGPCRSLIVPDGP